VILPPPADGTPLAKSFHPRKEKELIWAGYGRLLLAGGGFAGKCYPLGLAVRVLFCCGSNRLWLGWWFLSVGGFFFVLSPSSLATT